MPEPRKRAGNRIWIADDPEAVKRVAGYLNVKRGLPFCDRCLSTELTLSLKAVRDAIAALCRTGDCEQGLWWCGRCASKAFVTVKLRP